MKNLSFMLILLAIIMVPVSAANSSVQLAIIGCISGALSIVLYTISEIKTVKI